jgi:hypothetical protein
VTLLLPTDGCPNCITTHKGAPIHPDRVEIQGSGLRAWYRCHRCLYSWWTAWRVEALKMPCPGCEACTALREEGAA